MEKWNGKMKAVTFSYDDGNGQDKRLVELFNKYGVKCTFNINAGVQTPTRVSVRKDIDDGDVECRRLNINCLKELYKGHEVACHGLTHAPLGNYDFETDCNEIGLDKFILEKWFDCEVTGLAYPNGSFNDVAVEALKACGIKYARTVITNHSFDLQEDLLRFEPTCHHNDEAVFELIDQFLNEETKKPRLFYIWGHSYEFDLKKNWDHMEKILQKLSGRDDVFYGTNAETLL